LGGCHDPSTPCRRKRGTLVGMTNMEGVAHRWNEVTWERNKKITQRRRVRRGSQRTEGAKRKANHRVNRGATEGTESSAYGLGLEEGVGVAFVADGGGGAVAGVDDGVVGKMHEFGFQRADDLIEGAAPKIGAANAAGEERVSGEELGLGEMDFTGILGEIEADTAGRVAGSVNDVGLEAAPTESIAFLEKMIDIDEIGRGNAEEVGLHVHGMIERKIVVVHHDGSASVLMEFGETADVVNVGVGADDDLDGKFVAAE